MSTSETPGADAGSVTAPDQEAPPGPPPAPAALPAPGDSEAPDEPRHIHQFIAVRVEETDDAILVTRTEAFLQHRHGHIGTEAGERRTPRQRPRRLPGRRDLPPLPGTEAPGAGGFITFGSKSRLPAQMPRAQLIAYLNQERTLALDVRDPVAISMAAERYNTITAFLQEVQDGTIIDLLKPLLSVSQAAKILGYNAKEVRRLLGQGKISGRKVGSEWRIPLRAVL